MSERQSGDLRRDAPSVQDPAKQNCDHFNFRVQAEVNRIFRQDEIQEGPPTYFAVDIRLVCADCGQPFEWQGCPNGYSPYQPTVSIDAQVLAVSAMPLGAGAVPSGLPGFRVTHTTFAKPEGVKQ